MRKRTLPVVCFLLALGSWQCGDHDTDTNDTDTTSDTDSDSDIDTDTDTDADTDTDTDADTDTDSDSDLELVEISGAFSFGGPVRGLDEISDKPYYFYLTLEEEEYLWEYDETQADGHWLTLFYASDLDWDAEFEDYDPTKGVGGGFGTDPDDGQYLWLVLYLSDTNYDSTDLLVDPDDVPGSSITIDLYNTSDPYKGTFQGIAGMFHASVE